MASKENLSEWYHWILEEADIVDSRYPIKGMLIYKRWGLFAIREMQKYLEDLLEEDGHEPVLFPVLIPDNILGKETDHIAGFEEEVFWITHAGANELERRLALRPTSETPIYEMFSLWIRSHNDLPLKVHQSCSVYRYETKHTRPLIRGREFLWNEGHSAHIDADDAERNVEAIKAIYSKLICDLLCLPISLDRRPEWDKFPGAVDTFAFDTIMPDGRTLQIATVHNLGQNFSKVFDIKYEDANGEHQHVYQTSYGPSFGRLLAATIAVHGDDKGLILPPKIAPVQVIIIPIVFKETCRDEIMAAVSSLRESLRSAGIRAEVDCGEERPGAKFYRWEMKGVPIRVEIGPRDLKDSKMVAVRRDNSEKMQLALGDVERIKLLFDEITESMRKKAADRFKERTYEVTSPEGLERYCGEGILDVGWCKGKECASKLEENMSILCVEEKPARCVVCGGDGVRVKAAKTY